MNKIKKTFKENSGLNELNIFAGEWIAEAAHPLFEHSIEGKITFGWLQENSFFFMNSSWKKAGPPDSKSIIGHDDSSDMFTMLYSDERNVFRIYEMIFNNGILKLWRNFPGFSQRFTGSFKDNNNEFSGVWELCEDDINWKKDLEITYTRIKN
jgi:hypothetical protein